LSTEYLSNISQEVKLSVVLVFFSQIALQFAQDENVGLAAMLVVAVFQLVTRVTGEADIQFALADRSSERSVWDGNASLTL
jgi:hypothetical protein